MITDSGIMKRFSNRKQDWRIASALTRFLTGWIFLSGCIVSIASESDRSPLKVGWASADITPGGFSKDARRDRFYGNS